jgi:hypothetical protein
LFQKFLDENGFVIFFWIPEYHWCLLKPEIVNLDGLQIIQNAFKRRVGKQFVTNLANSTPQAPHHPTFIFIHGKQYFGKI